MLFSLKAISTNVVISVLSWRLSITTMGDEATGEEGLMRSQGKSRRRHVSFCIMNPWRKKAI
jgi:hypothetical protein